MAETKLSTTQLGGNEAVFSPSTLLSGDNISIDRYINPWVCDPENTIGIWHFDGNYNNVVQNSEFSIYSDKGGNDKFISDGTQKFGTHYYKDYSTLISVGKDSESTYTTPVSGDFWVKLGANSRTDKLFYFAGDYVLTNHSAYTSSTNEFKLYSYGGLGGTALATFTYTLCDGAWHHVAFTTTTSKFVLFFDGHKVISLNRSGGIHISWVYPCYALFGVDISSQYATSGVDEYRATYADLYTRAADFSSNLPNAPYILATDKQPDVYKVHNTMDTTGFATKVELATKADSSALSTVATTGAYSDLSGTPTIPTVNNATLTITQGGTTKGTFTANASADVTIDLAAGGGGGGVAPTTKSFTGQTGATLATGLTLADYDTIMVFKNGMLLEEATADPVAANDYSISTNSIVFVDALVASDTVTLVCLGDVASAPTAGANTSLSNITDEGKITAAHLAMPSATYDELSPSTADDPYVAPADGYFNAKTVQISSEDYAWLIMENQTNGMYLFNGKAGYSTLGMCMPVKKGDAVQVIFDGPHGGLEFLRFYYAVGSESEKQGA